jgi:Family of unknown function (DUF6228)
MDVAAIVYLYMAQALSEFFQGLADSSRGWEGERKWRSLEGELQLTASIDKTGHVWLRMNSKIRALFVGLAGAGQTGVELEAGQLEALAQDMKQFCATAPGEKP